MIISVFNRVENTVGKGEIACTSNFSFSHNAFKRLPSQRRQKVSLCGNGFSLCRQTDGRMDGQTVKQYAPDLSILGIKIQSR